jgi:hypothetical protein
MGRIGRRLEALEARTEPGGASDPEVRARMKALLDALANARREGRPPSPEAREFSEAFRKRRHERPEMGGGPPGLGQRPSHNGA